MLDEDQDAGEPLRQLARIGYDRVLGIKRPDSSFTETYQLVDVAQTAEAVARGEQVLDVRAPAEWETGVLEGSVLSYVPDLERSTPTELDGDRPVWLVCGTGYRATIAAGILQARGFEPKALVDGGATDVLARASKQA